MEDQPPADQQTPATWRIPFIDEEFAPVQLVAGLCVGALIAVFVFGMMGEPEIADEEAVSGKPQQLSRVSPWYEGASGYEKAMARQEQTGKPIFLYFYAPWCSYCSKFNALLVNKPEVRQYLSDEYINVRIYPQEEEQGFILFRQYGARGYPTVFAVHGQTFQEVELFKAVMGAYMMKSPEDFITHLDALKTELASGTAEP